MTITVDDVAEYVGTSPTEPNLPALLEAATDMVDDYLREDGQQKCPESIYDLSVLQLSSELYVRRNSPGGIAAWGPEGSVPARLSTDSMKSVAPMLNPYRGLGHVG